jgi:UDP-N-acetylglucosamine 2-epimerase (non-hydrolysing)
VESLQLFENKKLDIVTIAGNRPEVIKLSEIIRSFRTDRNFKNNFGHAFLYTGQHFSENMKDIFFDELDIQPDFDLRSNTSDISTLTDNVVRFLKATHPDLVLVYGDTNSTFAGALAATRLDCNLVHLEAGLRSFDMSMPEERNRVQTDSLSDILMAPTSLSKTFLSYEPANNRKDIFVTGNPIVDVCRKISQYHSGLIPILEERHSKFLQEFVLLTLHRQENVDDPEVLRTLFKKLSQVRYRILFPVHPRTKNNILAYNIKVPDNVIQIEPVGYVDFLNLLKRCLIVLTDSGGIQEEAVILRKPCITLRSSTERWETLLLGVNRLFPLLSNNNQSSLDNTIQEMLSVRNNCNPYGENVTRTTLDAITNVLNNTSLIRN